MCFGRRIVLPAPRVGTCAADLVDELGKGRVGVDPRADRSPLGERADSAFEIGLRAAVGEARQRQFGLAGQARDERVDARFENDRDRRVQLLGCFAKHPVLGQRDRQTLESCGRLGGAAEEQHGRAPLGVLAQPRTGGVRIRAAFVEQVAAPGGVVGVLQRLVVAPAPTRRLGEVAEHDQDRCAVERDGGSSEHKRPFRARQRHDRGAEHRAMLEVERGRLLAEQLVESRLCVAGRSEVDPPPGRRQRVVDHLLRNTHPGRPDEGGAQDLVSRNEPDERRPELRLRDGIGHANDGLRDRDRARQQERTFLLWRE